MANFKGKVQLITLRGFQNAQALLEDFDYTICMAATDGRRWIAHEHFFRDIERRQIVIHNPQPRQNRAMRLGKYCAYGFTPAPGVMGHALGLADPDFLNRFTKNNHLPLPANVY